MRILNWYIVKYVIYLFLKNLKKNILDLFNDKSYFNSNNCIPNYNVCLTSEWVRSLTEAETLSV